MAVKQHIGLEAGSARHRQSFTQEHLAEAVRRTLETVPNIEVGQHVKVRRQEFADAQPRERSFDRFDRMKSAYPRRAELQRQLLESLNRSLSNAAAGF